MSGSYLPGSSVKIGVGEAVGVTVLVEVALGDGVGEVVGGKPVSTWRSVCTDPVAQAAIEMERIVSSENRMCFIMSIL